MFTAGTYAQTADPQHWIPLLVFFGLFAIYGLMRKPGGPGRCAGCLVGGTLVVAANVALLLLAERVGYASYDFVSLLTLRDASIESTLIIVGYCIIVRELATLLRVMLTGEAVRAGRTYL